MYRAQSVHLYMSVCYVFRTHTHNYQEMEYIYRQNPKDKQ